MRSIRTSGRLITLFMVTLTVLAGSASVLAKAPQPPQFTATALTPSSQYSATITKDIGSQPQAAARSSAKLVSVIVKLKTAPLATYAGDVPGLAATSPQVTGAEKVDPQSAQSKQYLAYVDAQQDAFVGTAQAAIPNAQITHKFNIVIGGVSMQVPEDQVATLNSLPGVLAVYPDELQHLDTDASPSFIGATTLYQQLGGTPNAGKGVIFGVLDSGAWPEHPSFADNGNLGAPPAKADGTPRTCDFGDNPLTPANDPFVCNHKLIGGKGFVDTYNALQPVEIYGYTARDSNGHGTHTGTTAAGDPLASATVLGVDRGPLNGIAPGAWVSVYKVCGEGGCYQSDSAAAVQQAIKDGVNVINFSISGGGNPYADAVELAFLDAYNAGIFVAASAGNSGPGADTTDHRGPWVATVAASRQTRAFESTLTLSAGGTTATFKGASITAGISSPLPVVLASAPPYNDVLCDHPAPPGLFVGKIVACQRSPGRVLKGFNVKQGGAAGMILYNPSLADALTDNHWLPVVHLADGTQFRAFMEANTGVTGSFTAGTKVNGQGDVMAAFSSRGGPGQTLGISKPDITAPGVQILAGHTPTPESPAEGPPGQYFQAIAGTSMSSPHIAGSAILLKALHPTWTPGQIKSALMTTAWTKVVKENGTTPADAFDYGSGRVNLKVAGDPGLTFDVTGADYVAHSADLWSVNYPSVFIPVMPGGATVNRTAHSVLPKDSNWKLKVKAPSDVKISVPSKLKVPAGSDATFAIKIDARDVPIGQVRFATLTLTQDGDGKRELHLPITILRQQPAITVAKTCTPASFPMNATTNCTTTMTNTTFDDATVSLYDKLPDQLNLINSSVVGGTQDHNRVLFSGTLAGAEPPDVTIAAGPSVAGYLPLSMFGITPIAGVGDDTITNFSVPAFVYAGETYTTVGVGSNGYVVIGGGSGPDVSITNQSFPSPTRPNNVVAGFWTDLDPTVAGAAIRIGSLTDGINDWLVIDWNAVPEFSTPANRHSFEIWIGLNGVHDVTLGYGPNTGNGDSGSASVGAENRFGNRGNNIYFNGTGTLPAEGTELIVTSTPGSAGATHVVTYTAEGEKTGKWVNYAELTSDKFFGTNIARFAGEVTKK